MVNQRVIPNPMETRGVVVDYRKSDGRITLWTSTQAPHLIRSLLAEVLDLPEHMLRVIAPEVGGAFGAKAALYPEECLRSCWRSGWAGPSSGSRSVRSTCRPRPMAAGRWPM